MSCWVVAALEAELGLLIEALNAKEKNEFDGCVFYAGRSGDRPVYLGAVGVGVVSAALTLGHLFVRRKAKEVIMVGTAGALPGSGLVVGDLAVATDETLSELGLVVGPGLGDAEALGLNCLKQTLLMNQELTHLLHDAARTVAKVGLGPSLTVVGVSSDLNQATMRSEMFSALSENMEGYALALTAAKAGLKAAQVRGISNHAGQRDRGTWNLELAQNLAQKAVLEYLRRRC